MAIEIKTVSGTEASGGNNIVEVIEPDPDEIWYFDTMNLARSPYDDTSPVMAFHAGIVPDSTNVTEDQSGIRALGDAGKGAAEARAGSGTYRASATIGEYADGNEKLVVGDTGEGGIDVEYTITIRRVF